MIRIPNRFDDALFERALNGVPPAERLIETLLWRGFLVYPAAGEILVSVGSHQDDLRVLERLGITLLPSSNSRDAAAQIEHVLEPALERICRRVFLLDGINGMTGAYRMKGDFRTWKKGVFGAKVPVQHLDPAIALLVKVLPLCGVLTCMSCDGHTTTAPKIWFHSQWDLNWCKAIVDVLSGAEERREMDFLQDKQGGSMGYQWHLGKQGCGPHLDAQWLLYSSINRLARRIMHAARDGKIRAAKKAIASEEGDFRAILVQHLESRK
jgi:hypothetical protein